MFLVESETAAIHGQFRQARELARRAADSARRAQENETAAEYEGHNSVREGLVGLIDLAKEDAQSALATIKGKHGEGFSAIAFALAGDVAGANRAIDDLTKRSRKTLLLDSLSADGSVGPRPKRRKAQAAIVALAAARLMN